MPRKKQAHAKRAAADVDDEAVTTVVAHQAPAQKKLDDLISESPCLFVNFLDDESMRQMRAHYEHPWSSLYIQLVARLAEESAKQACYIPFAVPDPDFMLNNNRGLVIAVDKDPPHAVKGCCVLVNRSIFTQRFLECKYELFEMIVFDKRKGIGRAMLAYALKRFGPILVENDTVEGKLFFNAVSKDFADHGLVVDFYDTA
jgi:hypothetical protein